MTIKWHCRTCNKEDKTEMSFDDIVKQRKKGEMLIDVLIIMLEAKHKDECSNPNIGTKNV